jgi:hypothetical protein
VIFVMEDVDAAGSVVLRRDATSAGGAGAASCFAAGATNPFAAAKGGDFLLDALQSAQGGDGGKDAWETVRMPQLQLVVITC